MQGTGLGDGMKMELRLDLDEEDDDILSYGTRVPMSTGNEDAYIPTLIAPVHESMGDEDDADAEEDELPWQVRFWVALKQLCLGHAYSKSRSE